LVAESSARYAEHDTSFLDHHRFVLAAGDRCADDSDLDLSPAFANFRP